MNAIANGKLLRCTAAAAIVAAASLFSTTAFAALLVMESFTHPDGNLTGQTPEVGGTWATHSGTTGQLQVVSGEAKVNHALGEDTHTDFDGGPIGAGDKVYAAFDLSVPSQATDPGTVYFAHFKNSGNNFNARVFITAPDESGAGYRLGISGNSTLIAAETWGSDLAFDTTYRVVSSYTYDTGAAQIWVDPIDESSTSITATDVAFSDAMEAYALRESTSNSMQLVDNLCVATTFGQALNCTPEPASVVLMALAGLALMGVRRRAVGKV